MAKTNVASSRYMWSKLLNLYRNSTDFLFTKNKIIRRIEFQNTNQIKFHFEILKLTGIFKRMEWDIAILSGSQATNRNTGLLCGFI